MHRLGLILMITLLKKKLEQFFGIPILLFSIWTRPHYLLALTFYLQFVLSRKKKRRNDEFITPLPRTNDACNDDLSTTAEQRFFDFHFVVSQNDGSNCRELYQNGQTTFPDGYLKETYSEENI